MNRLRLLFSGTGLLVPVFFVFGQNTNNKTSPAGSSYPFGEKKNEWKLERNFYYGTYNVHENGQKIGHSNTVDLNLEWNRFFWKDFAIGLDIDATWSGDHYTSDYLTRNLMGFLNLTYGQPLSPRANVYFRLGAGIGYDKTISKTSTLTTTDKADIFGIKGTIGFPLQLPGGNNTYLTPKISYRYLNYKYDNSKENDNRFLVGVHLESYLRCGEMACDHRNGFGLSSHLYHSGTSYLGYTSQGAFSFGKTETTYTGTTTSTQKDKNTRGNLEFEYVYYLNNFLGIGAGVGLTDMVQKSDAGDFKYTQTGLSFSPKLVIHPFQEKGINNLFLQLEGGFGSQKTEYNVSGNSTTTKYSTTDFGAYIGYNNLIAEKLSFTPLIGYDWETNKNKQTDIKEKYDRFYFGVGFKKFF
ncbi:MAG: hypothetical protein Q8941_17115 [Bacteroidota bacterium]|nr:hypothetical protein [Bacteroidota bacterium]